MRITSEAKAATGQRILTEAARLFRSVGWDETTTREIAAAAGIANGTLFNYFPCKEAIAAALIEESLEAAEKEFAAGPVAANSLKKTCLRSSGRVSRACASFAASSRPPPK